MTNTMTCEVFHDRLMAYLEDETNADVRTAIERHAVTCTDCGAILADLRKLRIDAANLPELAPSRDLWAGIAERIEAPVVPIGARNDARPVARPRRAWTTGLMAASLVGTTVIGYLAGQRGTDVVVPQVVTNDTVIPGALAPGGRAPTVNPPRAGTPEPPASAQAPAVATAPAPRAAYDAQLVVANLTADYDREIRQLNVLLQTRRNQMDPVTVAIIEKNLQVIDAAITEAKLAIARDPASRFLIESLNQSLQMKVELMRTAAMLPSRT